MADRGGPPPGLTAWLRSALGPPPAPLVPLAGGGGERRYFRLPGRGLLALHGPDRRENLAWLKIGRHLWFKGLPLPRLRRYDLERGFFLLDDLGDGRLDLVPDRLEQLPRAVDSLARLHRLGRPGFNPAWGHQTRAYTPGLAARLEVGYFLKAFAGDYLGLGPFPARLRAEAREFSRLAVPAPQGHVLMHRDFQGRNLIVRGPEVFILDWQGARPGPAAYDLASLLEDHPHPDLPGRLKESLTARYLRKAGRRPADREFRRELIWLGAARLMQALGAFGRLTLAGKPGFTAGMAPLTARLARRFQRPPLRRFAALKEAVDAAAAALEVRP